MKAIKRFLVMFTLVLFLALGKENVLAAEADGITWISEQIYTTQVNAQAMPDGNWFDPVYYSIANPDVVAVLGTDTATLYSHYVNHGEAEGRLALDPAGYDYVHIICDGIAPNELNTFNRTISEFIMRPHAYWIPFAAWDDPWHITPAKARKSITLKITLSHTEKEKIDQLCKIGTEAICACLTEAGTVEYKYEAANNFEMNIGTWEMTGGYLGYWIVTYRFSPKFIKGQSKLLKLSEEEWNYWSSYT